MPSKHVKGSREFEMRFLKPLIEAKGARIQIGFDHSKYPNGQLVAAVAARNEFGHSGPPRIPERPFFRQAMVTIRRNMARRMAKEIDPKTGRFRDGGADRVGKWAVARVRTSITKLREPPNAPLTIKIKGSSNPLIDTKLMWKSVTYIIRED